ncbi:unnamed protein product, partial [Ectocarpus sp. 4 AP-2014]
YIDSSSTSALLIPKPQPCTVREVRAHTEGGAVTECVRSLLATWRGHQHTTATMMATA